MSRVNITVPDEILVRAKEAGINLSQVAASALADELDRRRANAELDRYLAELETELGPVPESERLAARQWADEVLSEAQSTLSRRSARSA